MNPSGIWCNPPPPGTDDVLPDAKRDSPERVIDKIDPFLKSSEYIKYEKRLEHSRRRSRSRSRHRRRRSRSRHRHRRRRHSASRSRSRTPKRHRRRHSRSRSRSSSRTRSHRSHKSRHHRSRSRRHTRTRSRSRSRSRSHVKEPIVDEKTVKVEEEVEEEEEDNANENVFKNDGSFMEMFKKMQEEQQKQKVDVEKAAENRTPLPAFGKRRGGKVLKTGLVQKNKTMTQEESDAQDAWTLYMKEVKRYKEACCDDDSKTRLLVK